MSLTLDRMRTLVRKGLGNLSTIDMPNSDVDELLNLSLWELEDKFPFRAKETVFTAALVTDQHEYSISGIPLLDAIKSVSWLDEDGKSHKLDRMTRHVYDEKFNDGSSTNVSSSPEFYLREDDILTIWPPPKSDFNGNTLRIALKEGIASLDTLDSDDTTGLPRNWDEIVVAGAIERGHFFNQDYDDMKSAVNYRLGLIRSAVTTESKEEEDSQHAGLQVLWDAPR